MSSRERWMGVGRWKGRTDLKLDLPASAGLATEAMIMVLTVSSVSIQIT